MATVRYSKVADFRNEILGDVLGNKRRVLGATRLAIMEKVPPMSLHIGIIRLVADKSPELDFLVDTTEVSSSPQPRVFCSIAYREHAEKFVNACLDDKFGPCVSAY